MKHVKLIICLDDKNGMAFNKRRQASDCAVTKDIVEMIGKHKLYITSYTKQLFEVKNRIIVSEKPFQRAGKEDFVFVENEPVNPADNQISTLIVYRWNRRYPADIFFHLDKEWKFVSSLDFPGHSHEKITKEIYTRTERKNEIYE